jgi:hypothetical protein
MNDYPKVLSQFPESAGETFMPSNGTEGEMFNCAFCERCIHEKWTHTQKDGDKKCDILSRSFIHWYEPNHPDYPKEWKYNEEGWPVCTEWVKWDWGNDGDPDNPDNPKAPPPPPDPNQLDMFPLYPDERTFEPTKKDNVTIIH